MDGMNEKQTEDLLGQAMQIGASLHEAREATESTMVALTAQINAVDAVCNGLRALHYNIVQVKSDDPRKAEGLAYLSKMVEKATIARNALSKAVKTVMDANTTIAELDEGDEE